MTSAYGLGIFRFTNQRLATSILDDALGSETTKTYQAFFLTSTFAVEQREEKITKAIE
jgi:hypothetical protein